MSSKRNVAYSWAGLATLVALMSWPVAASAQISITGPSLLSAPSPFAPLDCGESVENNLIRGDNTPFEPQIAVNPGDPSHIVAVYIQDFALSNVVRVSKDAGASWQTVLVPGLTLCTGGTGQAAADPSLAFSSNGRTLYLASLTGPVAFPHGPTELVVSRSVDEGSTWSQPVVVKSLNGTTHDMNFLTADVSDPATAYLTWPVSVPGEEVYSGILFSKTTDSGAHWSSPTPVYFPPLVNHTDHNAKILSLPGGELVDVLVDYHAQNFAPPPLQTHDDDALLAARSTDGGQTWSEPVTVGVYPGGIAAGFPPKPLPLTNFPSAAVAPDGTAYVAWPIMTATGASRVAVAKSIDGGKTWQQMPAASPDGAQSALAQISVAGDGAVGLTYYQLQSAGSTMSDVWFARSLDGGMTWERTHLAGPFDAANEAPGLAGGFIGDYEGLAPWGRHGFVAAFEMTAPLARNGPTDIFFAAIGG